MARNSYHTSRSVSSDKRKKVFETVWNRYRGYCRFCNRRCSLGSPSDPDRATLDHIKPASKGGRFHPDNLQLLCNACNQAKANKWGGGAR